MPLSEPVLRVLGDVLDAERKILGLRALADDTTKTPYLVTFLGNADSVSQVMGDVILKYKALQDALIADPIKIRADDASAQATFAKLMVEYELLQKQLNKGITMGASPSQVLAMSAAVAGLTDKMNAFRTSLQATDAVLYASGGGWLGLLGKISLFGQDLGKGGANANIFNSISNLHLLLELGVEFLAVWIPAGLAVGAFAIAASDAFHIVGFSIQNMHTVMDSTLQAIPPFTRNLENLHKQIQPQVFQLYGMGLLLANQHNGAFNNLALGTGSIIDQLAARATAALSSGGAQVFIKNSLTDVRLLGTAFGNLFGAIGNVIKETPQIAQVLLQVGTSALGAAEHVTAFLGPALKVGMALHGAFIYTGLAVTGFVALSRFATGTVVPAFQKLIAVASEYGTAIMAGEFGATKLGAFLASPTGVAVAIAAATALATAYGYQHDKIFQVDNALKSSVLSATSMSSAQQILSRNIKIATGDLANQQSALSKYVFKPVTGVQSRFTIPGGGVGLGPAADTGYTQNTLSTLQGFSATYNSHMQELTKTLGGTAAAQQAVALSGVSVKQMLTDTGAAWAADLIQIQATDAAYKSLGYSAGTLGNDYQMLNRASTDQYKATQTLNQGWQQFVGDVTSTQSAFDTWDQGLTTMNSTAATLHLTLGNLHLTLAQGKAAIDSLTPSGIALNQAFSQQVTNTSAMIATWRTAGLTGTQFDNAIKASIAPLAKFAMGSKEGTAMLMTLAQQAGYTGPLQGLYKWLGNVSGATQKVKDAANAATIQEALLTGAMNSQGQAIAGQLISQLNAATLKYSHVTTDINNYAKAVATSGTQSDAAAGARKRLIADITQMGLHAHSTTGQIAAIITKLLGIPTKVAIAMVLNAEASIRASETISVSRQYNAINPYGQNGPGSHAAGTLVPSGFPHDSYHALLTSGEAVVPAHLTPYVAPFLASRGVPGFATGFVPSNMASYTGSGGSSGDTYNIMVAGDSDPDGAAKRIHAKLRDYKTHRGGMSLGL